MKTPVLCIIAAIVLAANAYLVNNHLKTTDEFTLAGRFCFSTVKSGEEPQSAIIINQTAESYNPGFANWVLYIDTESSWDANYNNKSRKCIDKRLPNFTYSVRDQMSIELKPHDYVRPHIWYVVLLNCPSSNSTEPDELDITYTLHFINQDGSEVGYDEEGMLALNACFFVFFMLLAITHCIAVAFMHLKGSAHPIVYILAGVIILMVFSLFFVMIHWAVYDSNGVGANGCRVFGQLLMGTANVVFAVLLIAIASGWAITYHDLPRKWTILGITIAYFVCYLILFIIITATGQTAASTQFVYAKGALLAFVVLYILVCWIGVWGYFAWCLYRTWREEAQFDKRLFYLIFGIGATAWFILPALFNFISMCIAEWYRPRVVDAFQLTASFIGVVALVALLWPSRVEKYFRISSRQDLSSSGAVPSATPSDASTTPA